MDGVKLPDPTGVFNASLDGGIRRAIKEMVDAGAFVAMAGANW